MNENLKAKLSTIEGWKAVTVRGLFNKSAKKNLAQWSELAQTGVYPLHAIRRDKHDDFHYAIFAFSILGDISEKVLQGLAHTVSDINLGNIRYDALGLPGLTPLRSHQRTLDMDDGTTDQISIALTNEDQGLFVFVASDNKESRLSCPLIAFGLRDRTAYIYPLDEKSIQALQRV